MAALDDAQAFLGSFMSLITESELRYEGYLFYLNTREFTIGLRNVKSYGTEGRRRDGPQILPVNRVFQYLYFRGSDIKSLDVLSAPDVNMTEDLPEDPAIIRDHYLHQSYAFMNMMSTTTVPQLPAPTFPGSLPLTQSVGSSWCWRSSSPPPTRNDWTGYPGSSEQLPPLPKAMLVSPPGKPATVASHISPGHIPYTAPTAIHSSPSVLPGLNENAHVPPVSEKPEPMIGPTLPCQTSSQPGASIAGGSSVFVSDEDGNTDVDVAESLGSGKAQEPEY